MKKLQVLILVFAILAGSIFALSSSAAHSSPDEHSVAVAEVRNSGNNDAGSVSQHADSSPNHAAPSKSAEPARSTIEPKSSVGVTDKRVKPSETNNKAPATVIRQKQPQPLRLPDLTSELSIYRTYALQGITYYDVAVVTRNIGNGAAPASQSLWSYAMAVIGGINIPALEAGGRNEALIRAQRCRLVDSAFEVWADSANRIAESNERNNYALLTLPACPKPDLIMSGLAIQGGLPGRNATVTATTKNAGRASSLASTTRVSVEGNNWHQQVDMAVLPLGMNQSNANSLRVYCPWAGTFTVTAIADALNTNAEMDESNNGRVGTLECGRRINESERNMN